MKSNFLENIITIQIASIVAFLLVPVYMIGQAPQELHFVDFSVLFSSGLFLAVLLSIMLSSVLLLLHKFNLGHIANGFSLFIFVWIVISGFMLPVSSSTGMVDPEVNPIDKVNLIAVVLISVALAALAHTKFRASIYLFLSIVIIGSVFSSLYVIYRNSGMEDERYTHYTLSDKGNILVVSFDGLPGEIIADLIKNEGSFNKIFRDFTYFENVVSQSPATQASLFGEVYGVRDYKSLGKDQAGILGLLDKRLGKHLLTSRIKDSYQYNYKFMRAKKISFHSPVDTYHEQEETFDLFRYIIVRLATRRALELTGWNDNTKGLKEYLVDPAQNAELLAKLRKHTGRKWDKKNVASILKYNHWVDNLKAGNKEFSVRYLHFTFTHFPVDFDANCNYKSDEFKWHKNNQNTESVKSESMCALKQFASLLNKLKQLGIYDKSLIILKSDHGKPSNFFADYPNNLRINGQGRGRYFAWGYNRYRPMLMIKDYDSSNTAIKYRKELVLLNDIAMTLCTNSRLDIRCDLFPGINLLGKKLASDKPYYLYVVKDSKSDFKFDTHISVRVPSRKMNLLQVMKESSLISLSSSD